MFLSRFYSWCAFMECARTSRRRTIFSWRKSLRSATSRSVVTGTPSSCASSRIRFTATTPSSVRKASGMGDGGGICGSRARKTTPYVPLPISCSTRNLCGEGEAIQRLACGFRPRRLTVKKAHRSMSPGEDSDAPTGDCGGSGGGGRGMESKARRLGCAMADCERPTSRIGRASRPLGAVTCRPTPTQNLCTPFHH